VYRQVPAAAAWVIHSFLLPAGPLCFALGLASDRILVLVLGLALCGASYRWWHSVIREEAQPHTDGRPTVGIKDVRYRAGFSVGDEGGNLFGDDAWDVYFVDGVKVRYLDSQALREALSVRCPNAPELRALRD